MKSWIVSGVQLSISPVSQSLHTIQCITDTSGNSPSVSTSQITVRLLILIKTFAKTGRYVFIEPLIPAEISPPKRTSHSLSGAVIRMSTNDISNIGSASDLKLVEHEILLSRRLDDQEFSKGIVCIGAAIRQGAGAVIGSISVSLHSEDANKDYRSYLSKEMIAAANLFSNKIRSVISSDVKNSLLL